jgi:hypothetical protein
MPLRPITGSLAVPPSRNRVLRTTLRAATLVIALFALAACGGDEGTAPEPGVLALVAASNCPSASVGISIDGGTEVQAAMTPGQTVRSFSLSPGRHTVEARMVSGEWSWPEMAVIIESKQTYQLQMQCP